MFRNIDQLASSTDLAIRVFASLAAFTLPTTMSDASTVERLYPLREAVEAFLPGGMGVSWAARAITPPAPPPRPTRIAR